MKQINFLSWRDVSTMSAMTIGSPSVHRRKNMLKHTIFILLFLIVGVGNVWAQVASAIPATGKSYVVAVYSGSKYIALPNIGTTSTTWDGEEVTINANGKVSSENPPLWEFTVNPSNSNQFYLTYKSGNSTYYFYRNGTGNNKKISAQTSSNNYWTFTAGTSTNAGKYSVNAERGSTHTILQYTSSKWQVSGTSASYSIILLEAAPSGPTLTKNSSMTTLTYSNGTPVAQSFTIGGANLTSDVTVTAPTNYEVCKTSGGTYTSSVTYSPTAGTLADQTVYIRLKTGLSGGNISSSNIEITSTDAPTQTIAVTGSVPYTITWMANGSTHATTYVAVGSTLTLPASDPTPNDCGCTGKAFYGWYGAGTSYSNATTAPTIAKAGDAVSANKTYYAVFADETGSTTTWNLTALNAVTAGTYAIMTGDYHAFNGSIASGKGGITSDAFSFTNNVATSAPSGTCEITFTAVTDGFKMYNSSNGYLYAKSNSSGNLAWHNSETSYWKNASSNWVYNSNSARLRSYNNGNFNTYSSDVSSSYTIKLAKKTTVATYSNYATTCCTPLGTINGSVELDQNSSTGELEAIWEMNSTDGLADNGIIIKIYEDGETPTLVHTSEALSKTTEEYTVSSFTPKKCTQYYATLTTVHGGNAVYCEGNVEQGASNKVTTAGYSLALKDADGIPMDGEIPMGLYSITGDLTNACAEVTISVEQTNEDGYHFESWDVYKTGETNTKVTVNKDGEVYSFTMPAYDVTVSALFAANTSPTLTVKNSGATAEITSVAFGNQESGSISDAQTIKLVGENLKDNVAWALSGADAAYFAVTPESPIAKSEAEAAGGKALYVTFTPNAAREFSATLTFSSTDATAKAITLSGTGVDLYTVTLSLGSGSGLSSTTGWTEDAGVYTQKQASLNGAITLPSAAPSDDCSTLGWTFAGWATDEATSGDKPELIAAGEYTPTSNQTLYAVYKQGTNEYKIIGSTEELEANEYYVLTYEKAEGTVHAMTNTLTQTYYTTSSEETVVGTNISSPSANAIWKLTGNSSAWRLYNEASSKYIDLSDYNSAPISESTTYDLLITLYDANAKKFNIGSKTTSINYLQRYQDNIWGVDNDHDGYYSAYIFKREAEYKTSPNCAIYTLSSAVDPTGKGTVALSATSLTEGATATATYTLTDEDYRFVNWTISGEGATFDNATANPVTITMGSADATITANFEAIPTYTVTWNNNGSETSSNFKENVKPTFPATPVACDATSTTFYGWATEELTGKLADLTSKTVYTSAADMPASNTAVTYYAVFAKASTTTLNRVTNVSQLYDGCTIAVVDNAYDQVLKNDKTNADAPDEDENGDISISEVSTWTLQRNNTTWRLYNGSQYLGAASVPASSYGEVKLTANENIDWTISANATSNTFSFLNGATAGLQYYQSGNGNTKKWEISYDANVASTSKYAERLYVPILTDYMTTCCKSWADPTVAYGSYSLEAGGTHATVTITGTQHGTPGFASSNISVITVNATTGEVTPVGAGTAHVIVTWPETDGFCEKIVNSSDFTVTGEVAVSFNANGGSGDAMPNQMITVNTATALNDNTYGAPACKYFYGWATSKANADAETRAYTDGQKVTITEGMELWAIWKVLNYAVTKGTGTGTETFTLSADNVDCGGSITVTSTPDASHKGAPQVSIAPSNAGEVSGTTISNITAAITVNVTFAEKESFEVIWNVNGVETKKSFVEGTTFADVMADAAKPVVADNAVSNCANKFMGWATAPISAEHATANDVTWFNGENTLSAATTFYAVWATSTGSGEDEFTLVEEELSDWSGTYLLVNYSGNDHAMSSDAGSNNGTFKGVEVTPANKVITCTNDKLIWTLAKGTGANAEKYSVKSKQTGTYANIGSSSTSASLGSASYFSITFDENHQAKISNGRWFSYASSYTQFRTYGGEYNGVYLYKKGETSDYITSCCALQPATNIAVSSTTANSVTLTWTDPSPVTGITKLQVVDANDVLKVDNIALGTETATISGLTECDAYTYRIISVGNECEVYSESVNAVPFGDAKTVTFQYNDGETADLVVVTSCSAQTVNIPANPSREGYQFQGWFNGEAQVTSAITPTENMTIDAHWAQLYTVTYDLNGGSLSPAPVGGSYIAGAEVTLISGNPSKVFSVFNEWTFSPSVTMIDETHFTMPAENVTITATYIGKEGTWMLVTDATTLAAEDTVVIAYNGSNKVAGEISSNVMASVAASFSTDKSVMNTVPNDAVIFKLSGNADDGWAFNKIPNGEKLGSTAQGKMAWDPTTGAKIDTWMITIAANGNATIAANETPESVGKIQYNSGSPRFTTYTSNQSLPQLYRFREGTFYAVNLPTSVVGGTIYASPVMAKAGQTVTLTYTPSQGYTVKTLTVSSASENIEVSPVLAAGITEYTFTMPAEAVTVAAEFELLPSVEYTLVESVDNLAVGMEFLLVGSNAGATKYYASGAVGTASNSDKYLAGQEIGAPANKQISITTQAIANITLEGEPAKWKLMVGNNQLFANDEWTIAINEGVATIAEVGATNNIIQFNTSGTRFKDYTSNQQPIAIYALPYDAAHILTFDIDGTDKTIKVVEGYEYTITNTTCGTAPANCTFLNKWTDGTHIYAVGNKITLTDDVTLIPCWKQTIPAVQPGDAATINSNTLPASVTEVVVQENMTFNVTSDKTYDNLTIEAGGKVSGSANLTVNDFTIESQAGKSGQLASSGNVTVTGDIYMDVKFYSEATLDATSANQWYMISAPFNVNLNGGFLQTNGTAMVFGSDFDLFYYDGNKRANTGVTGWTRVSGQMPAGRACLIGFNEGQSTTIRLKAASNTISNPESITLSSFAGDDANKNWNGVANPRFQYTSVDKDVQVWNNEEGENGRKYITYGKDDFSFVVGTPFFVQATGSIDLTGDLHSDFRAPKRSSNTERYSYRVQITREGATEFADQMYVRASDEATNTYEQGHDMITWNGTSGKSALLWSENYGMRLAIEEAPLVNNEATYTLGIFAPNAGEYVISTPTEDEDATLYLTLNGHIIWNLSQGAYTAELQQGQNSGYGLKIVAAPKVSTDVEQSVVSDQPSVQKVIIDDHVYILRGGQMYDVNGKLVK